MPCSACWLSCIECAWNLCLGRCLQGPLGARQEAGAGQCWSLMSTESAWELLIALAAVWSWGSLCWELGFGWLLAACCSSLTWPSCCQSQWRLNASLVQEPDHSVLHSMLNTIEQIVKLLAPDLMSLQQIQQAFDRWKVVLSDSSKRRRERAERQQQEDWDQEEEEAVQVGSPLPLSFGFW